MALLRDRIASPRATVWPPGGVLAGWLAAVAVAALVLSAQSLPVGALGDAAATSATVFLGIVIEALPFLLLGVVVAATVEAWVPDGWVHRHSPRGKLTAPLAGIALALALPVCECGVIPVARQLLRKGAPLPLTMAFMLAGPAANPVSILATTVAFGGDLRYVLGRLIVVCLVAGLVAVVFGMHPGARLALRGSDAESLGEVEHEHGATASAAWRGRLLEALVRAGDDFAVLARWLILGALIAAALQVAFPRGAWPELGGADWPSVPLLMALAAVMSICSTVDSFVALSFAQSVPLGAVLAFLAYGSMVDIKSTLMYLDAFRRGTVVALLVLVTLAALLAGLLANLFGGY